MARPATRSKEYWKKYRSDYYIAHKKEMNEQAKIWAKKNKSKVNKKSREWRKNNPEKRKTTELKYKCKIYGISLERYNELFLKQNGVCAICRNKNIKFKKSLSIDHCHRLNKVRGLLCDDCNLALGLMKDDIDNMKKAVIYLKKNQ